MTQQKWSIKTQKKKFFFSFFLFPVLLYGGKDVRRQLLTFPRMDDDGELSYHQKGECVCTFINSRDHTQAVCNLGNWSLLGCRRKRERQPAREVPRRFPGQRWMTGWKSASLHRLSGSLIIIFIISFKEKIYIYKWERERGKREKAAAVRKAIAHQSGDLEAKLQLLDTTTTNSSSSSVAFKSLSLFLSCRETDEVSKLDLHFNKHRQTAVLIPPTAFAPRCTYVFIVRYSFKRAYTPPLPPSNHHCLFLQSSSTVLWFIYAFKCERKTLVCSFHWNWKTFQLQLSRRHRQRYRHRHQIHKI